jgi:molybdopterin biosynthesis enzyme
MVSPLAASNGFIMIDESVGILEAGASVLFIPTRATLYRDTPVSLVTR